MLVEKVEVRHRSIPVVPAAGLHGRAMQDMPCSGLLWGWDGQGCHGIRVWIAGVKRHVSIPLTVS